MIHSINYVRVPSGAEDAKLWFIQEQPTVLTSPGQLERGEEWNGR